MPPESFVLFAFNVSQMDFRLLCEIRNRLFIVFHIDTSCLVDFFFFLYWPAVLLVMNQVSWYACLLSVREVVCLCYWSSCVSLQHCYLSSLQTVFNYDGLGFFDLTVVQKWYAFIRNHTLIFDLISSVASDMQYDTLVWCWAVGVSHSSQSAMQPRG